MNKKNILAIALVVIIGIGVTFFILFKIFAVLKTTKENGELTKQMSPALLETLKQTRIYDYPYSPAAIQWEGKFLQLDDGAVLDLLENSIHFTYNKQRNEALNTQQFFPGNDINGIVWIKQEYKTIGQYEGGGYASQPYYVISFLDLKQQAILARDTVWGGMPPKQTRNGSETGKLPDEKEVIKLIQERTKN